jgi:hypothetical protein
VGHIKKYCPTGKKRGNRGGRGRRRGGRGGRGVRGQIIVNITL